MHLFATGRPSRQKRAAGGNSMAISMAVAACRAWDNDLGDWVELGDVVSHQNSDLSSNLFQRLVSVLNPLSLHKQKVHVFHVF